MHSVEGTDAHLHLEVHEPSAPVPSTTDTGTKPLPSPGCPVLLLHGFGSSVQRDWEHTGWIAALTGAGRRVIAIDLPGHGGSGAPEDLDAYSPSRLRADLLQAVSDAGARPVREGEDGSGLDIVGYALGSRLAWEFGATQPELVRRMVLVDAPYSDPFTDFDLRAAQQYLADGTSISHGPTAELLDSVRRAPDNNLFALLSMVEAFKAEPFIPAEAVPHMPLLLISGQDDDAARQLADLSGRADVARLPNADPASAAPSPEFQASALAFLNSR